MRLNFEPILGLSNTEVAAGCSLLWCATATPTPAVRNQENREKNSRPLRGPISRMGRPNTAVSIASALIRHFTVFRKHTHFCFDYNTGVSWLVPVQKVINKKDGYRQQNMRQRQKSRGLKICSRSILPVRQINIWQALYASILCPRKTWNYYHKRRLFTNTPA